MSDPDGSSPGHAARTTVGCDQMRRCRPLGNMRFFSSFWRLALAPATPRLSLVGLLGAATGAFFSCASPNGSSGAQATSGSPSSSGSASGGWPRVRAAGWPRVRAAAATQRTAGVSPSGGRHSWLGTGGAGTAGASGTSSELKTSFPDLASNYQGDFSAPPKQVNTDQTTDAPLLGNGDVGVAILNNIDTMTFVIDKNEFWTLSGGAVRSMARLSLANPSLAGASYSMQAAARPSRGHGLVQERRGRAQHAQLGASGRHTKNKFITELKNTGNSALSVSASLDAGTGTNPGASGSMAQRSTTTCGPTARIKSAARYSARASRDARGRRHGHGPKRRALFHRSRPAPRSSS